MLYVQYLLSSVGFYEVWLAQGVGNVNAFVHVFEQCLRDNNVQNWNSRIEKFITDPPFLNQLLHLTFSFI